MQECSPPPSLHLHFSVASSSITRKAFAFATGSARRPVATLFAAAEDRAQDSECTYSLDVLYYVRLALHSLLRFKREARSRYALRVA